MVRNLFFVYTLFAERFAHLFQCSTVGFVCRIRRCKSVLHCQFDERNLPPCFAFRFTICIKIFVVIIMGTVIGDVPYYYEVEFPNPDTGEMVIGYIYKKNLVNVEATETEEFTNPEDNGTEAKEDITSITDESEGQAAQKD